MKANSVIRSIVCLAAAGGLAAWFGAEHRARLRLGEEHAALELQLAHMDALAASNLELSNRVTRANRPQPLPADQQRELLRLRGEAGVLRRQSQGLEAARNENRQAHAALEAGRQGQGAGAAEAVATADYWPRDSWAFAGFASPDAAVQTSLWAANNGDVKSLLASATGDLRKHIEEDLAGKSGPEAAIRAMDEVISIQSLRVLSREVQADDTTVLTAAIEGRAETQTVKMLMKKIGGEWKISGPAK
jgi:hypothetical protein